MCEYTEQANKFLKETNTEISATFLRNGHHFQNETEFRDIFKITITRKNKRISFNYGQSINLSGHGGKNKPTSYDVLSCLQKYPVESFQDFCDNFGYEQEKENVKIYHAVKKEYENVCAIWNDKEIEQLQEIN